MLCDRMDVEKPQRVPPFSFSALWDVSAPGTRASEPRRATRSNFLVCNFFKKKFEKFSIFDFCKRILDTWKSFCYFWALDMAPTWAVPACFQSTRTGQNSSTKVLQNFMVPNWIIWPSELNQKGFSSFPRNTIPGETKEFPFQFFPALWDFSEFFSSIFFHRSIFWCFATMDVKKCERIPLLARHLRRLGFSWVWYFEFFDLLLFLSLRYGADLCRSRLVNPYFSQPFLTKQC